MKKSLYSYPTFNPPEFASKKDRFAWTKNEANQYFEWLMSVKDDRVNYLVSDFQIPLNEGPRQGLQKIGEAACAVYEDQKPSGVEKDALNPQEYALAADIGLFIARLMISRSNGTLSWRLVTKPKNYYYYNLPVLNGFKDPNLDMEPISISINQLSSVKEGTKRSDAWGHVYSVWEDKLKKTK